MGVLSPQFALIVNIKTQFIVSWSTTKKLLYYFSTFLLLFFATYLLLFDLVGYFLLRINTRRLLTCIKAFSDFKILVLLTYLIFRISRVSYSPHQNIVFIIRGFVSFSRHSINILCPPLHNRILRPGLLCCRKSKFFLAVKGSIRKKVNHQDANRTKNGG